MDNTNTASGTEVNPPYERTPTEKIYEDTVIAKDLEGIHGLINNPSREKSVDTILGKSLRRVSAGFNKLYTIDQHGNVYKRMIVGQLDVAKRYHSIKLSQPGQPYLVEVRVNKNNSLYVIDSRDASYDYSDFDNDNDPAIAREKLTPSKLAQDKPKFLGGLIEQLGQPLPESLAKHPIYKKIYDDELNKEANQIIPDLLKAIDPDDSDQYDGNFVNELLRDFDIDNMDQMINVIMERKGLLKLNDVKSGEQERLLREYFSDEFDNEYDRDAILPYLYDAKDQTRIMTEDDMKHAELISRVSNLLWFKTQYDRSHYEGKSDRIDPNQKQNYRSFDEMLEFFITDKFKKVLSKMKGTSNLPASLQNLDDMTFEDLKVLTQNPEINTLPEFLQAYSIAKTRVGYEVYKDVLQYKR